MSISKFNMNNLKWNFFLVLILAKLTINKCYTGCLRCVNNKCTICDISRFYLKNGECFLRNNDIDSELNFTANDNCIDIDFNNKCKRCTKYYYLNEIKNNCLKVEKKSRILKCIEIKEKICKRCQPGYYLDNNVCTKFSDENIINNCISAIKKNVIICEICKKGYIPSIDLTKCVKTTIKNCLFFSYIDCTSCQGDRFLVNRDNYTTKLIDDNNLLFEILIQSISLKKKITLFPVCYQKNVKNCLLFEDTDNCLKCNEFYYLKNINGKNLCVKSPNTNSSNYCIYSKLINGAEICLICETEFLLQNGKCVSYTKIDFCTTHIWSNEKNSILCKTCYFNYLLDKEQKNCLQIDIINNCEIYDLYNEKSNCNKCKQNFFLSSSKDFCIQKIENCEEHKCICDQCGLNSCQCDKNCTKIKINCEKCKDKYFLNIYNFKCEPGNINKCKIYKNINICGECESGYYLKNNSCFVGNDQFCDKYLDENNCDFCIKSYFTHKKNISCILYDFPKDDVLPYYSNCENEEYTLHNDNKNFLNCNLCKFSFLPLKLKNVYYCAYSNLFKYFITDGSQQTNTITDFCQFYDEFLNCEKCEDDYYLDNGKCTLECYPKFKIQRIFYDATTKDIIINKKCYDNIPLPFCKKAIHVEFPDKNFYICEECIENYFKFSDFENTYNLELEDELNFLGFNLSLVGSIICFTVKDYVPIENCIIPTPSDMVMSEKCFYCKIGYKPSGNKCKEFPEAIKDIDGIFKMRNPRYVQNFLIILKCKKDKMSLIDNFHLLSSCVDPILESSSDYLANCGVYVKQSGGNHDCLLCNPGFKSSDPDKLPDVCEKIKNCDLDLDQEELWFNSCSKCKKGFAFKFNNNKISNDCVETSVEDCFSADSNGICHFCKEDFFLVNGKCDKLQFNGCDNNSTNLGSITILNLSGFNIPIAVTKKPVKFNGCQKCLENKVPIKNPLDITTCEKSDILLNNNYISNCLNLNINLQNEIICKKCDPNYTLSYDYKNCLNLNKPDCYRMDLNLICIECQQNYTLENQNCKSLILNCKEIINEACFKCISGYTLISLKNNKKKCFKLPENCLKGKIKVQSGFNYLECQECGKFSYLENISNDNFLKCEIYLKSEQEDNCSIYDKKKLLSDSTFECLQCDFKNFYKDIKKNECILRDNKKEINCLTFDECGDQCAGGCACGNCDNLAGLDGCVEGYFFDYLELKICLKLPLSGCKIYLGDDSCKICLSNYYLENDKCRILEKEKIIQNCEVYEIQDNNIKCIKCFNFVHQDNFYYLSDNQCKLSKAKNCKTNKNQNECLTCFSSYYLKKHELENIKSCIKNDNNCIFYSESELEITTNNIFASGHCKKCISNEYLLNNSNLKGNCESDEYEKIQNCELHEKISNTITCKQCHKEFGLKNNKCNPLLFISNSNLQLCNNFFYNNNFDLEEDYAKCSLCDLGFYLKNEKCYSCDNLKTYFCNICVRKKEGFGECLLCQSGYYMNEEKKCLKNIF